MPRDDGVMSADAPPRTHAPPAMTPSGHHVSEIAKQFADKYYDTWRTGGPLYQFYAKPSRFSRIDEVGAEFNQDVVYVGAEAVKARLEASYVSDVDVKWNTMDYQMLGNVNAVLVVTTGVLEGRMFTQSFVLAEQPDGYFVQNDMLRFISVTVEPPRDHGLQKPMPTRQLPRQVAKGYLNGITSNDAAVAVSPSKSAAGAASSPKQAPRSPVVASPAAGAGAGAADVATAQAQQQQQLAMAAYRQQQQQVEQQLAHDQIQAAQAQAKQAQQQAALATAQAQAHATAVNAVAGEVAAAAATGAGDAGAASLPTKLNGVRDVAEQQVQAQDAPPAAAQASTTGYDNAQAAAVEPQQAQVQEEPVAAQETTVTIEDERRQVRFPAANQPSPDKQRGGQPQQQYRRADQQQSPRRGGGQQQGGARKRQTPPHSQNQNDRGNNNNPNNAPQQQQQQSGGRRGEQRNPPRGGGGGGGANNQQQPPRSADNAAPQSTKPQNPSAQQAKKAPQQQQQAGGSKARAPQQKLSPHENEVKSSYAPVPEKKQEPSGPRSWSSLVGGSSRPTPAQPTVNSHPPLPTKTTTTTATTNGVSSNKRGGGAQQASQNGRRERRGKRGDNQNNANSVRSPQGQQRDRDQRSGGRNNEPSTSSNEWIHGGIWVKNLPRDWKEDGVREFFSKEGAVKSVDMRYFSTKGFVTLSFANARVAEECSNKSFPDLPDLRIMRQRNPRFGGGGGRGRGNRGGGDDRDQRGGGNGRFSRGGRVGGGDRGNRGGRGGGRGRAGGGSGNGNGGGNNNTSER